MSRKPIFAANWKMNKGASDTADFVNALLPKLTNKNFSADIVIAPSFLCIPKLSELLHNQSTIEVASQNCSDNDAGAFTGEVSTLMLREFFVRYVIIGHSERRSLFGETDAMINSKIMKALSGNLEPIFCIGETLAEREGGKLESVLSTQITEGLKDITEKQLEKVVIAYEPVWAIGTGVTATSQQAQDTHAFVRSVIAKLYSTAAAEKIRIQYGGSVKPNNAAELMACPDIDGALIGGAALEAGSFFEIIQNGTVANDV